MELSGEWSISDDTGLEVDALDGRPGIHAARYAGPQCSFEDNINKLLGELGGVPDEKRTARFVCVIALCCPDREPVIMKGSCAGRIRRAKAGAAGFGYDPVFGIDELGKTFAELTMEEKNRISHRGRAVKLLRSELVNLFSQEEVERGGNWDYPEMI
jgi:XTP/dITP diphosphohydrolase